MWSIWTLTLSPYAAVVLEDLPLPDESAAYKLREYVAGGGKLLVLGGAILSQARANRL